MNFDPRRVAGDTIIMFSCGGRADGSTSLSHSFFLSFFCCLIDRSTLLIYISPFSAGQVTNSQLFPFKAGQTSIVLAPESANGDTCFVDDGIGRLNNVTCTGAANQVFTIG